MPGRSVSPAPLASHNTKQLVSNLLCVVTPIISDATTHNDDLFRFSWTEPSGEACAVCGLLLIPTAGRALNGTPEQAIALAYEAGALGDGGTGAAARRSR